MEEVKEWVCPFYHRVVDSGECIDMHLVAMRAIRDEELVKEEDRDALDAMCEKCQKYTL